MKMKFNRMERIAGLFVLLSLTGTLFAAVGIVIKKGFFEPKVHFHTTTRSSNSIRPGTPVQMAGLRAGSVHDIELGATGEVKVDFVIFRKYVGRVKADSRLRLIRPSLLGDRVVEITMGGESAVPMPAGALIPMTEEEDAIDVLSGKRLAALLDHVDSISLEVLGLLKQVSHGKNVQKTISDLRQTVDELRKSVKSEDLSAMIASMNQMTREMAAVAAKINESSASFPESARKIDELLGETTIMVRGMQKNWLFRSGVNEAREESKARMPASAPSVSAPAP